MSFLGTTDNVVFSSVLQEIMQSVYAPNAVTHVLKGNALHARLDVIFCLPHTTLHALLISKLHVTNEDTQYIHLDINTKLVGLYGYLKSGNIQEQDVCHSSCLHTIETKFSEAKT
jgi:hypothetical protein